MAQFIDEDAPVVISRALSVLLSFAASLEELHSSHSLWNLRDDGVRVSEDDEVEIIGVVAMDEGGFSPVLEKLEARIQLSVTPPEAFESGAHDVQGDIYGFGVYGYELVVGKSPFAGDTVLETMTKNLEHMPPPPSELRPECPSALSDLLMKAMSKDKVDRFSTASELVEQLKAISFDR